MPAAPQLSSQFVNEESNLSVELNGVDSATYGHRHTEDLVAIYKLYVERTDEVSLKRERANAFFLTLSTALLAAAGFLRDTSTPSSMRDAANVAIPIALAGIAVGLLWIMVLQSHRELNRGKFIVIQEIEKRLPIRPFSAEWTLVGHGPDASRYRTLSHIETVVAAVFVVLNVWALAVTVIA